MNFLSEKLSNLSGSGQLYVMFQMIYIIMGIVALWIFYKLYKVLVKILKMFFKLYRLLIKIDKHFNSINKE